MCNIITYDLKTNNNTDKHHENGVNDNLRGIPPVKSESGEPPIIILGIIIGGIPKGGAEIKFKILFLLLYICLRVH